MSFCRGDRVKLTAAAAARALKGYSPLHRKIRVDWPARRGTVTNTPLATSSDVVVHWDGTMSNDHWPKGTLEKAE